VRASLIDTLRWWSRRVPDQPALTFEDRAVTWHEWDRWTAAVAHELTGLGVGEGDRVAIGGENSLEWAAAAVATIRLGAVICPVNIRLVAGEIAPMLSACAPTVIAVDDAHRDLVNEAAPRATATLSLESLSGLRDHEVVPRYGRADTNSPACIIYTSGSTGRPKGATLTHGSILFLMMENMLFEPSIRPNCTVLTVLPLGFASGLVHGLLTGLVLGGHLVMLRQYEPRAALTAIERHQVAYLLGVPMMFERICELPEFEAADVSSLQATWCGGAPVPRKLLETWLAKGVALRQGYGLTEMGATGVINPRDIAVRRPEVCGDGGVFNKFRIVRPEGDECETDEPGEIQVSGPTMMSGYWGDPEATAAAIQDGWLTTGDVGRRDDEGYLNVIGRIKDVIITGGINVYPSDIEAVLLELAGLDDAVVFGVPDAKFGETPAAVVATSTLTVEDIVAHCNGRMADYKVPRHILIADQPLPRLLGGKIDRPNTVAGYRDRVIATPRVR
jgi:fatty-acyl-CoA synthase